MFILSTLALSKDHQEALFAHLKDEISLRRLVILATLDDTTTVDAWGRMVPVPSEIHRALRQSNVMTRWYQQQGGASEHELTADTALVQRIQAIFTEALHG